MIPSYKKKVSCIPRSLRNLTISETQRKVMNKLWLHDYIIMEKRSFLCGKLLKQLKRDHFCWKKNISEGNDNQNYAQ